MYYLYVVLLKYSGLPWTLNRSSTLTWLQSNIHWLLSVLIHWLLSVFWILISSICIIVSMATNPTVKATKFMAITSHLLKLQFCPRDSSFIRFIFVLYICVFACVSAHHVHGRYLQRPEGSIRFSRTGVTVSCHLDAGRTQVLQESVSLSHLSSPIKSHIFLTVNKCHLCFPWNTSIIFISKKEVFIIFSLKPHQLYIVFF